MTDAPAVALLFDEHEPGLQLRQALQESGAHIVHEGPVRGLSLEWLGDANPDVLVVNLDDSHDDVLEQLYALIDGEHLRVVFNDAQASRTLQGWDRARWARHLAAKVLEVQNLDPPRPPYPPAAAPPVSEHPAEAAGEASDSVNGTPTLPHGHHEMSQSALDPLDTEALAAELETLMAAAVLEEHDNHDRSENVTDRASDAFARPWNTSLPEDDPDGEPSGGLCLEASVRVDCAPIESAPLEPFSAVSSPDSWSLLEMDELPPTAAPYCLEAAGQRVQHAVRAHRPVPGFGPARDDAAGLALELEVLEAAVAAAPDASATRPDYASAWMLHEPHGALRRIVMIGATRHAGEAVIQLLTELPPGLPCAFVLVQHQDEGSADEVAATLAAHARMPVRALAADAQVRQCEWWVMPAGQSLRLARDGRAGLQPVSSRSPGPSIDASFSAIAQVFGRDALAIVLSGSSIDALGGCQAVHDRGGRVWVEQSSERDPNRDMVSAVVAEGLTTHSASPQALAHRLVEELVMEKGR